MSDFDIDPEEDADEFRTPVGRYRRSDPGHPLGAGYPTGRPLGVEGSHQARWMAILRNDPCAFCGFRAAGTIDHITPRARRDALTHTWLNYTGACGACNGNKKAKPLLRFLWDRCRQRRA